MIVIRRAETVDAELLSSIAIPTFHESHGHSADTETINNYVNSRYNPDTLREELADAANIFHVIFYEEKPAGYSKIIFNHPFERSPEKNITKLERIYILREYYDKKLGQPLFDHNCQLAKDNRQAGIWLYVWVENKRAIAFYKKNGFVINGSYDFKLSEHHANPNHRMFLQL
jgi:ribosomal protein S18 acetylase RimI-like enzyme